MLKDEKTARDKSLKTSPVLIAPLPSPILFKKYPVCISGNYKKSFFYRKSLSLSMGKSKINHSNTQHMISSFQYLKCSKSSLFTVKSGFTDHSLVFRWWWIHAFLSTSTFDQALLGLNLEQGLSEILPKSMCWPLKTMYEDCQTE